MTDISDLLRRSMPEEIKTRSRIKGPITYLSERYGPGSKREEFVKGTWALELNATLLQNVPGFKGWDAGEGIYGTPLDDSPSIKNGRIIVRRSFNGRMYARLLAPEELSSLGYKKIANVSDYHFSFKKFGVPADEYKLNACREEFSHSESMNLAIKFHTKDHFGNCKYAANKSPTFSSYV